MDENLDPSFDSFAARPRLLLGAMTLLAIGALLAGGWQQLRRNHQRRLHTKSQPLPHKLQTWEGEGGRPDPQDEPVPAGMPGDLPG